MTARSHRMFSGRLLAVSLFATLLAGLAPAAAQTVIYVNAAATGAGNGTSWSDAYQTVQPALTAAQPGTQVWVAAGRYVGCITLKADVALYGGLAGTEDPNSFDLATRNFTVHEAILDGNQAGSVVTAPTGATATCRIDGFTITNGSTSDGGGVYLYSSSPAVANNTITGNTASSRGGGLFLHGHSSPTITNNSVAGNSAGDGGGLYLDYGSNATIANNTIAGNSARDSGGGLYLGYPSPTITNNTISGNSAGYHGGGLYADHSSSVIANNTVTGNSARAYGGGLYADSSSSVIANNTVAGNSAGDSGGGLYLHSCSSSTITNNRIAGNNAGAGGGLYLDYGSNATIANNTIAGNGASSGGGLYLSGCSSTLANNTIANNTGSRGGAVYCNNASPTIVNTIVVLNTSGLYASGTGTATLRFNCVYGNAASDYSGVTDPTGTSGNISADPRLAGPAFGNYHLQPDSPCLNAGANASVYGATDLDGQARVQGNFVDIGADESDGTMWPPGPYAIVRVSPTGNDACDGSSWASAKRTVQGAIQAAVLVGGEVWVQAGTYYERITLEPYAHVYGGFNGTESTLDQRDWRAHITTLDGQRQGTVVTGRPGDAISTLDGFTITGGYASSGGGMYLSTSAPTIAHNRIAGNTALGEGGGMYLMLSFARIVNNVIAANNAGDYGGGGLYLYYSSPRIGNNTITANAAVYGGGLYLDSYSAPTITNTVVAFNSSGIRSWGSGVPVLRNNCVYGNTEYNYWGLPDPTGADGNLSVDPLLAAPAYGNYHLQPSSPCLNGGSNADAYGAADIDGQPRIQGDRIDIGADESDGTAWPPGPYGVVRVSPTGNDAYDGSSWTLAKRTVQAGIQAAAAVGGDVWVQEGTYYERITLLPFAYVFGGFRGAETTPDERNWRAYRTTLDGQQLGPVVTGGPGQTTSTLDGFTIQHGGGINGDGIFLLRSSPTIVNNTITSNSGAGLFLGYSSSTIANNTIGANGLGGLFLYLTSARLTNNTITGNNGHGLSAAYSTSTIANTIVAFNASGISRAGSTTFTLRANCVFGNTTYNYSGLTDPTGTAGNISADPLFLQNPDPNSTIGDLHLQTASPCINAGNNADVWGTTDLDGFPRIVGPNVDMGAYEYPGPFLGDLNGDGLLNAADFALFAACFTGPGPDAALPPDCSPSDLDADTDVDLADFARLQALAN